MYIRSLSIYLSIYILIIYKPRMRSTCLKQIQERIMLLAVVVAIVIAVIVVKVVLVAIVVVAEPYMRAFSPHES